jgi:soluble lytic murein transglycosylase-like protein
MSIQEQIAAEARRQGIRPELALAVAAQESGFNQSARSPVGAIGIMQLMPGTAQDLRVNPYDAAENIRGGVTYLRQQLARFGGDEVRALQAYNGGPGHVLKGDVSSAAQLYARQVLARVPMYAGSSSPAGFSFPEIDFSSFYPDAGQVDPFTIAAAIVGAGALLLLVT